MWKFTIGAIVALVAGAVATFHFEHPSAPQAQAQGPHLAPRAVLTGPEPAVGLYWVFSGDPTTGGGVCGVPQWQLGFRTDNNTLYYHSGTSCTAWTVFAAGGGAISSITCLTGLTCTPEPITSTGTIGLGSSVPTGSGSAGYYAAWLTANTLGIQNIDDEGNFGDTTRFFNTYNRFDHGVYAFNGDFIAGENPLGDGGGFGSGRLLSYYSVGSALGGGSANVLAEDLEPVSDAPGTGGNIQFFGNIGASSGASEAFAAEWKASKTTGTLSDQTFDLIGDVTDAGADVEVCVLGHDGSFTVPNGLLKGEDGTLLTSPSVATSPLTVDNANTAQNGSGTSIVVNDTGTYAVGLTHQYTDTAILANNSASSSSGGNELTLVGVEGNVTSSSNNIQSQGVAGVVTGAGDVNIGVFANASGGTSNYSFYGSAGAFFNAGSATVNAGGYFTGDTGFSNTTAAFTPGTTIDVRTNNTTPLEIFNYVSAVSGTKILIGKGRGVIGGITGDLIGDNILAFVMYGYDSNAAINNNAQIQTNIDQAVSAGIVPSNFQLQLEDAGGTMRNRFRVDSAGHRVYSLVTSPTPSSCGATPSPTVGGTDNAGFVTLGGGATACTITFAVSWATPNPGATADCTVTSQTTTPPAYTVSNTAISITTGVAGTTYHWQCSGY